MKIADITFGMPRNKAALNPAGVAPEGQPTTLSSSLSAAGNAMLSPGLADGVAEHICDLFGQQGAGVPTEEDECGMSMG